jgi:hypothetical protein
MDSILHAAANTCEDFPGGVTGMAAALGKNKFSLMHEVTAAGTAKLGVVDAAKIAVRSKDPRIPNAFAEICGGLFIPGAAMLQVTDGTLGDLSRLAGEFAQLVQEVTKDARDDEINDNEMARIEREWAETVAAGQALMLHLRASRESAQMRRHLRAA